ncbi:MAG: ketoacyl-ACP synthase III [Lachnospiraceae bacterium]|nr:ketoacyl-ACP synthase III [Lachnospiraceae bacterium]
MAFYEMRDIEVAGMAAVVPDRKVGKEDFIKEFGEESVEKFIRSTGIHSIHRALEKQTASDLGYEAAKRLLDSLEIERSSIGIMLFVTQSPDYRRPASAYVLHKRLGLSKDCSVMDIGLGCSGFVYGHHVIGSMLATSDAKYALLILGETASKLVNPKDKSIAMMYGDAGAAVLYKKSESLKRYTLLKSDGSRFKSIILPAGGFRDMYPEKEEVLCSDGIKRSKYDIYMDGIEVFAFSTSDVPQTIQEYLRRTETEVDDYDLVLLHQANQFIIRQIGRKLKVSGNKLPVSLDRYGNTGGISIPLTICDYVERNKTERDKLDILASGFGIGLSWGVTEFSVPVSSIFGVSRTGDCYEEGIISPEDY